MLKFFQVWPVGTTSRWLIYSFSMHTSFEHFLTFRLKKMFILYFLVPALFHVCCSLLQKPGFDYYQCIWLITRPGMEARDGIHPWSLPAQMLALFRPPNYFWAEIFGKWRSLWNFWYSIYLINTDSSLQMVL